MPWPQLPKLLLLLGADALASSHVFSHVFPVRHQLACAAVDKRGGVHGRGFIGKVGAIVCACLLSEMNAEWIARCETAGREKQQQRHVGRRSRSVQQRSSFSASACMDKPPCQASQQANILCQPAAKHCSAPAHIAFCQRSSAAQASHPLVTSCRAAEPAIQPGSTRPSATHQVQLDILQRLTLAQVVVVCRGQQAQLVAPNNRLCSSTSGTSGAQLDFKWQRMMAKGDEAAGTATASHLESRP